MAWEDAGISIRLAGRGAGSLVNGVGEIDLLGAMNAMKLEYEKSQRQEYARRDAETSYGDISAAYEAQKLAEEQLGDVVMNNQDTNGEEPYMPQGVDEEMERHLMMDMVTSTDLVSNDTSDAVMRLASDQLRNEPVIAGSGLSIEDLFGVPGNSNQIDYYNEKYRSVDNWMAELGTANAYNSINPITGEYIDPIMDKVFNGLGINDIDPMNIGLMGAGTLNEDEMKKIDLLKQYTDQMEVLSDAIAGSKILKVIGSSIISLLPQEMKEILIDQIASNMADAAEKLNGIPYYRPDGSYGAGHNGVSPLTQYGAGDNVPSSWYGKYEGSDCGSGVLFSTEEAGFFIRQLTEKVSTIMPFFDTVNYWNDAREINGSDFYNEVDSLAKQGKILRGYVFFYQRSEQDENAGWDHTCVYLGVDEDGKYGYQGQHIMLHASSGSRSRNVIVPVNDFQDFDREIAKRNGVPYRIKIGKPNERFLRR